ncbi:uncharacterized protein LOC143277205 [Babylonia areolata]|uniref:uncharacterized protein LOC143277205 n=1 Tax=Babylonia areolata TaxID=304850 RepID=UPI003FD0189D
MELSLLSATVVVVLATSMKDLFCVCSILFGVIINGGGGGGGGGVLGEGPKSVVRFEDIPFQRETKILNKTVTCGERNWGKFTTLTYTCDDIRVDGLRLAYGYYPGWGVDETCQETGGKQELAQLCRFLLQSTDLYQQDFYGVFVNNATCSRTSEKRYMLEKQSSLQHQWTLMDPGHGWLSSISCMVRS